MSFLCWLLGHEWDFTHDGWKHAREPISMGSPLTASEAGFTSSSGLRPTRLLDGAGRMVWKDDWGFLRVMDDVRCERCGVDEWTEGFGWYRRLTQR